MVKEFEINGCNIIYDSYNHIFGEREFMLLDKKLNPDRKEKISLKISIPTITEIRIHISNICKLSCSYCYLKSMNWKKDILQEYQLDEIVTLIEKCDRVEDNCTISYLGAEPLDEFEKIKYLTEKLKGGKRKYLFALSTNGYSLDKEKREYLIKNNFKIVISIDGDKKVHDRFRHDSRGNGSYDKIIENLKEFRPKSFDIQSVITRNASDLVAITRHHEKLNPNEIKYYLEVGNQEWSTKEIIDIKKKIASLWEYFLDRFKENEVVPLRHNIGLLNRIHSGNKRFFHCGAGISSFFIGNDMKLYPCNMCAYNGEELNILHKEDGSIDVSIEDNIKRNVLSNEKCNSCWAKYFCGGSCYANKSNICEILEYDIMYSLYAYICMYKENKDFLFANLVETKNRFSGYIRKIIEDKKWGEKSNEQDRI